MPKRGIKSQLFLPFQKSRVDEIFDQWRPKVENWHRFQDTPTKFSSKQGGNCFYWWKSRYSEWIQEMRPKWSIEIYIETDKLFPLIWESYEEFMTRSKAIGIPNAALEN